MGSQLCHLTWPNNSIGETGRLLPVALRFLIFLTGTWGLKSSNHPVISSAFWDCQHDHVQSISKSESRRAQSIQKPSVEKSQQQCWSLKNSSVCIYNLSSMFIEFRLDKSKAVQNQNLESAEGFCSTVFQLGVCRNFRSPVILSPTIPIPFNFLSCAMLSSNEIGSSVRRRIPWTRQSFLGRWQRWKWRQPMPPIHQRHQLHQSINPLWMMPEEGGILISIVSQIFLIDIRDMQHVGRNKFPASLSSLSPSAVKHPCQLAVPNCDMSWESAKRFNMFTFQHLDVSSSGDQLEWSTEAWLFATLAFRAAESPSGCDSKSGTVTFLRSRVAVQTGRNQLVATNYRHL